MVAGVLANLPFFLLYTVPPFLPRVRHTSFSTLAKTRRTVRLEPREHRHVRSACGRYTRIKSIVDGSSWPLHWISIGLAEFSRPFLFAKETWYSSADCKLCRARGERNISAATATEKNLYLGTHVYLISTQLNRNTSMEPRCETSNAALAATWHFDPCEPFAADAPR